jgi:hypothetical protein
VGGYSPVLAAAATVTGTISAAVAGRPLLTKE